MYYSIIEEGKFLVIVADGIAHGTIMELPTEKLADEVAFQLQMTWNSAEDYGKSLMKKELDPDGYSKETSDAMKKVRFMTNKKQQIHSDKISKQLKAEEKRVRKQVLQWKKK